MEKINLALDALRQGKIIILVDNDQRENEGDLVMAAEHVTPEAMNFIIKNTSGIVCLCLPPEKIKALALPMMVQDSDNTSRFKTGFTVSIEAKEGVTTGVSAADRVRTIQAAIHPNATPDDLARPGHVFPLLGKALGVLEREGHTEGSLDLMRMAGLTPAAVLCEVMRDDGAMARLPDLKKFAQQHDLLILSIDEIKAYRLRHEVLVEQVSQSILPIEGLGVFSIKVFRDRIKQEEYIVLQRGDINPNQSVLVRLHSQCMTGDVFLSARCDCGWQLQESLKRIAASQQGVMIYMGQEGRGIGIANKIKAYALQDQGFDTVEANHALGFPDDLRDYTMAQHILRYLNVKKMVLLTNNPYKIASMKAGGFDVERQPLQGPASDHNQHYLSVKRQKLGHLLNK